MTRFILVVCAALSIAPTATAINPITRVVQLMEGLTKKIEADGKAEEDLFEKYVCWYKTVVSTKKAANAAASDRIEALTSYIDDVRGGRVEFTSESKDLEAEVAKLMDDVQTQKGLRQKQTEDFEAAKDEMEMAITALRRAVDVLNGEEAGAASATSLTSVGFDLRRVIDLGRNSLSKADAKMLAQALDSGGRTFAPKLGGKRGTTDKIREILNDMLQTFQDNLDDAIKKEADSKITYGRLITQKESQLSSAQEALAAGTAEADARALQVQEAQEEIDALTEQVTADEGYIQSAQDAYASMLSEWKERKRLRAEEVAGIGKAIAVLTSDDARDTMSASFKSQTGLLLQEQGHVAAACLAARAQKASEHISKLAKKHKSAMLAVLAADVKFRARRGSTDAVVEGIEKILSDLHKENDADLKVKEDCEDDRNSNTKMAKNAAYEIDKETAVIVRKKSEIEGKQQEIQRIQKEEAELKLQREEAQVRRNRESAEHRQGKADDENALTLVAKAKEVLEEFYTKNSLALLQGSARKGGESQPVVEAGLPPPPPPSTWSEPYGGAKGETGGIQSILSMIVADIEKDIAAADATETTAIADYDKFMQSSADMIDGLKADVVALEGEIGEAENVIKEARSTRADEKKVMDGAMMMLRSIAEGCDFMAANFEFRKQAREEEVDGLIEAEAMLSGGEAGAFRGGFMQDADASC